MIHSARYRWRKTTDISREYALFELLHGETPLLDLGFTDEGALEVAFNSSISGEVIALEKFLSLLDEARILAENDK